MRAVTGFLLCLATSVCAQVVPQAHIDRAIDRGVEALRSRQASGGRLGPTVGAHALALLALLKSGVPATDPVVVAAIPRLEGKAFGTYGRAIRLLVIDALMRSPGKLPERVRRRLTKFAGRDAESLARCQNGKGAWSYRGAVPVFDNSNTQYAIFGLRAADRLGIEVPERVWRKSLKHTLSQVSKSGGVGYTGREDPTASMTAGALSSLVAATSRCELSDADDLVKKAADARPRMIEFLARTWRPGEGRHPYYTLYGLERAMAFSFLDRLGKRDWYQVGARWLVDHQRANGLWPGEREVVATSFALLFLARATQPTPGETPRAVAVVLGDLGEQPTREGVREAARKLAARGRRVAPVLVHLLSDPRVAARAAAVLALRDITGEFHGYEPRFTTGRNRRAIDRWRAAVRRGARETRPGAGGGRDRTTFPRKPSASGGMRRP